MRFGRGLAAAALAAFLVGGSTLAATADEIDDRANAQFSSLTTDLCFDVEILEPDVYTFTYRDTYEGATDHEVRVYRYFCGSGAYNQFHVYFTWTENYGIQQVAFPTPTLDIQCVGGGNPGGDDCNVTGVEINGFRAEQQVINSEFDPATLTITNHACWRGVCDAWEEGVWVFHNGEFVLTSFEVDPSYDGEINGFHLVDYATPARATAPTKG